MRIDLWVLKQAHIHTLQCTDRLSAHQLEKSKNVYDSGAGFFPLFRERKYKTDGINVIPQKWMDHAFDDSANI